MEVQGDVSLAEAGKACAPLGKRLYGWRRWSFLAYLLPVLIAGLAAQALIDWFVDGSFGILACVVIMVVGWIWAFRRHQGNLGNVWVERGVPPVSSVSYRADDDGIHVLSTSQEITVRWNAVSEIAPGGEAWLFVGPGLTYFLPRRLFPTPTEEIAFLGACFERMRPEARQRSREIAKLIAS